MVKLIYFSKLFKEEVLEINIREAMKLKDFKTELQKEFQNLQLDCVVKGCWELNKNTIHHITDEEEVQKYSVLRLGLSKFSLTIMYRLLWLLFSRSKEKCAEITR